jgi:serine/threonine protein kinase/Flp pilus assembly protein TadD
MIGRIISHYKILSKLGEGGLGVVYRAEDSKLGRPVALKFLLSQLTQDVEAKERFINEARAASSLDHSSICTIYEIGKTEDDQLFIAMALCEGESLKAKIANGPLDVEDAVGIAAQVAAGLARAHGKGIFHRDIKPSPIMVTSDGDVKIVDFGLAVLAGQARLTRTGTTSGTAAYMSPEQARGEALDHRTDIWSLGVVLYEMLTGLLPFKGEYEPALIYSILNDKPAPMSSLRPGVPRELDRVVKKALAKNQGDRYQNVTDLLADLQAFAVGQTRGAQQRSRARPTRTRQTTQRKRSIAVLPFRSLSDSKEDEYFSDGTTEDIITQLSKISELRVISRTSIMRYKQTQKSIPEIGRDLGVGTILEGSVRRAGDRVRVVAQLLDAHTDEHIWAETYDREMKDVFAIQSDVAEKIATALRAELSPVEKERIERKPTESTEAYSDYLKGRFYWNKRTEDDIRRAIEYFNRAIEKDPRYAVAYAGLASACAVLSPYAGLPQNETMPKAEAAARRALELDPTLAEARAVLGTIRQDWSWDWVGAESEYKRAIELDPNYPTTHLWYSNMLCDRGRFDEALAESELAQDLDPLSLVISSSVGSVLFYMRQYDKAIEQCRKTIELDPDFPLAHYALGAVYEAQGKFDEAIAEVRKARMLGYDNPFAQGLLGCCYARSGKRNEAAEILNELLQSSEQGRAASYGIALVYHGLGDKGKAFEWLERAFRERLAPPNGVHVEPVWDSVRSDPQFVAILKRAGLEK